MSKPIRKGSFEDLIMSRSSGIRYGPDGPMKLRSKIAPRPGKGRPQMKEIAEQLPVNDRTARQFGLSASTTISEQEMEAVPFLRRCRALLRKPS